MPPAPPIRYVPYSTFDLLWRLGAASGLGALLYLANAMLTSEDPQGATFEQWGAIFLLDLLLGVVALVLLPAVRAAPLTVALLMAVIGGFTSFGAAAVVIALISLATRRRWREIAGVGVVYMASSLANETMYRFLVPEWAQTPWWVWGVVGALLYGLVVAIGVSIGNRRDLAASWRERAVTAEREQAARVDQARSTERTRIAREMHDVLAHRISLVAMHSGALAYRTDLTQEETAATAGVIRDNAHLAMTELREVLGVLRETDGAAGVPERPQPTLAALPDLLAEVQGPEGSDPVTCDVDPVATEHLSELGDQVSRSAYRILQESLTNARKHAPGEPVRVEIDGAPGEGLVLRVTNPLVAVRTPDDGDDPHPSGAPPSGLGLTGLAERARLTGGELTAGPDGAGRFVVRAWLPWT
ncbi:sensor histidine kinase [Oerskovia jenensis]|uniref:sensor histidine kinase n=1 Tax=Oerskovia jenensis TaxID=162169 RepID=UPI0036D8216A